MLSNEQRQLRRSWSDAVISFDEFYFQWHITDRCNLRCDHCYQTGYSQSSELTLEELKKVGRNINCALASWKLDGRIAVTGGEPFMRKDLFDILSFLEEQSYVKKIGILSNGTLIKDAQFLKKLNKLHYVQLSLEGRREINDAIRGKGVFDKVIESTGLLKESGIPVIWMITLHKKNAAEIPEIIDSAA